VFNQARGTVYHTKHQVVEYSAFHKASFEPIAVFIQIGLKVIDMVVHAPQPSLEVHDDSVQVREICPFFARRYAREVLELLLQGGISGPLVGGHFGLLAYVVSHKSTQLQGTSL